MATLADSLTSSTGRAMRLRLRPDLESRRQRYRGQIYWVVKEPVGLNYFRFHEEEYAILQMLDGQHSLEDIKEEFEREYAPQKITFQDLQQFVGTLHRSGLVVSEAAGQGWELKHRRDERKRKELFGKLTNVFALRFRGIDPERLLNFLYPYTRWFFSRIAVMLFLSLGLCALLLVAVQNDVFRSRLPTFHQFFAAHNWIYMISTMGIVKVLHEFGHGLSCKYFGGECHEMGVMFLVFTPCLYCNVSDSWMLPNKWHRAAIGAAGMYVELVLASFATFIWWFSEPGLVNHLALSVMFICSVSTLVFNGNPLLRFDGYYILMDSIEIPNLRQKATEVLKRFLAHLCLGIEQPENPFLPENNRFFFGLYTIAAVIYRWVVMFSILYFMNKILEPYGLKVIGQMVAVIGIFGLVVQPLIKLGKFFYIPGRMHKVKRYRVAITLSVLGAATAFMLFVPLPYHIDCVFTIVPGGAETVVPQLPGQLTQVEVKPGEEVRAGQLIARVDNFELQVAVIDLRGQILEEKSRISTLNDLLLTANPTQVAILAGQISQAESTLESFEESLAEKEQELEGLDIVAPIAGTVIPVPPRQNADPGDGRLPEWKGSLLDKANDRATVVPTDMICLIGDPTKLDAELVIDQAFIDFVDDKQRVELLLEGFPGKPHRGKVEKIADNSLQTIPPALTGQSGGGLDTVMDENGQPKPMNPSYAARVPIEDWAPRLQHGMRGKAKIHVEPQTLGRRLYRYMARTFHFDL
jgi:putative peptide zinc metalloprotease protein